MQIQARFPGVCDRCKQRFEAGTLIEWERGQKARHADESICQQPSLPIIGGTPAPRTYVPVRRALPNGIYTIELNGPDDYITIRLADDWRIKTGEADKASQVAQFLSGPDNETSYTRFAFVSGRRAGIWGRFKASRQATALQKLLQVEDFTRYGMAYAIQSNRCWHCNKRLTVPISAWSGVGPKCAEKLGINRKAIAEVNRATYVQG